jgi:DNA polymerase-3 subunit alpha
MYLIFDTETTGLPKNWDAPLTDLDNWPRLVQIAWQLHDATGKLVHTGNHIVKPDGFTIPYASEKVHGISTKRALKEGKPIAEVLDDFEKDLQQTKLAIAHNIKFDYYVIGAEWLRLGRKIVLDDLQQFCTAENTIDWMKLPGGKGGKFKMPTLTELHERLFGEKFGDAHDAAYDVAATSRVFFGLLKAQIAPNVGEVAIEDIEYEAPQLDEANFKYKQNDLAQRAAARLQNTTPITEVLPFVHLHNHSQYSVLQSTISVEELVENAKKMGMSAVALTDLGNMMGVFKFVDAALKAEIKPIVGCEVFWAEERLKKQFTNDNRDKRFTQVLLAKNKKGYQNLIQLVSLGFTEGLYAGFPRVDKALIAQYKDGLIATTGNLSSEIPFLILNVGETQAEAAFQYWHSVFGEDFYIELCRHGLEEEEKVNDVLLQFAEKYQVKYFASNDVFYAERSDADAHDALLCIKEGKAKTDEKQFLGGLTGYISRKKRFAFPNDEYYFKSTEDMNRLFDDLPEALNTTIEIVNKIETFKLKRDVLLPKFDIPDEFKDERDNDPNDEGKGNRGENAYLRHLTYEGAKRRYKEITKEIQERLDFELATVERMGFPGYFLIVQDFTTKAREMNVWVGPGRGSAAGSAIAYCLGITNIDPIAYDLLFERFLNPDRISMPDIDIDFDDVGRQKVIDYVLQKYGKEQVAQIITYGTLGGKSAIKDAGRVMQVPLSDTVSIAKTFPEHPAAKLRSLLKKGGIDEKLMSKLNSNQAAQAREFRQLADSEGEHQKVIKQAAILEGSIKSTGVHACGIIITPEPMTKLVPVSIAKDSDMQVTQFDNSVVESAGLLKMDFLGLKTLTILKDTVEMIERNHGKYINLDEIPLDDKKTFQLFQRGDMVAIFQFESQGMQKYMKELKPTRIEDLIAMNALYRPGPLEYIPSFIRRKNGLEPIKYDLPEMEELLKETYGITVYQEQVMRLSQKLANFTKGQADALRKAMGKKQIKVLESMKADFIKGCEANGHPLDVCEKIWKDWEAFASYAFNKSHATCYAFLAYQSGYLKAHYPAEFMASNLTNNMDKMETLTFLMEECKRMGIAILGPDVNESGTTFTANAKGEIRFGLGGIKGAGENVVQAIITERETNGKYLDLQDFLVRTIDKAANKKTYEALISAGSLDNITDLPRAAFFAPVDKNHTYLEMVMKSAAKILEAKNASQHSLFLGESQTEQINLPKPPSDFKQWSIMEKLKYEKDCVGFFLSGHPLDEYKIAITTNTVPIKNLSKYKDQEVKIAGIVTKFQEKTAKNGNKFGIVTVEDFEESTELMIFNKLYEKYAEMLQTPNAMLCFIGQYKTKWGSETDYTFDIKEIKPLSELGTGRNVRVLKITINLQELKPQDIDTLEQLAQQNKGNTQLICRIKDSDDNSTIELASGRYKVNVTQTLLQTIEKELGWKCDII